MKKGDLIHNIGCFQEGQVKVPEIANHSTFDSEGRPIDCK